MTAVRKPRRYQYLGWIIEKGPMWFYVLDWDYEIENVAGVFATERAAQEFCLRNS